MNAGLRLHWTRMSLEKLISLVPKLDYSPYIWIDLTRFVRVKVLECSAKDDINVKEVFRSFLALSKILPKNEVIDSNGGLKRRSSAYVSATSKGKRRAESPLPEKEKPSGSGTYNLPSSSTKIAVTITTQYGVTKFNFSNTTEFVFFFMWLISGSNTLEAKPRSRSLIRRASRKTKQQIRDAQVDECHVS